MPNHFLVLLSHIVYLLGGNASAFTGSVYYGYENDTVVFEYRTG